MEAECSLSCTGQEIFTEKKRIKVLKVVGEAVGQFVLANSTCINAIKIDRIKAHLLEAKDHLFKDKIIKQGTVRKEVFYVDPKNRVRYLEEDIPFTLLVEMPGFKPTPFTEVQNHLLDIDISYSLTPARQCIPGCLRQKIVGQILVKAAEWTQLDVVTDLKQIPRINSVSTACVKY
ncbi:MAG TPA: DUF3794 domain-containing protein [Firmicutes bacterium]|jgi:hypothetical protein|nr:DUF3794 domain-containing protein [Bacillota bacterium]HOQ24987.1 DUF3794 domain-containing protein [Bacillota bacterium]HPT68388.1 DUF3794 domain-containing protein [Bacillota bacterium]